MTLHCAEPILEENSCRRRGKRANGKEMKKIDEDIPLANVAVPGKVHSRDEVDDAETLLGSCANGSHVVVWLLMPTITHFEGKLERKPSVRLSIGLSEM